MRNLTYTELLETNGGHNGKAYQLGKKVADTLQEGWSHAQEFAKGLGEGLTS